MATDKQFDKVLSTIATDKVNTLETFMGYNR